LNHSQYFHNAWKTVWDTFPIPELALTENENVWPARLVAHHHVNINTAPNGLDRFPACGRGADLQEDLTDLVLKVLPIQRLAGKNCWRGAAR
jgi:hypothetical protein